MKKKNGLMQKIILSTIGHEKRQAYMIPVFSILISLIVGAVVIAFLGKNPFLAYYNLLQGSGLAPKASYAGYKGIITDLASFLNALTPMLLAALSVMIARKAGLFNIGVSGQIDPDFFDTYLEPGECLLLCYDGLSNMIEDSQILEILKRRTDLRSGVQELVDTANRNGGRYNIAVVLVERDEVMK